MFKGHKLEYWMCDKDSILLREKSYAFFLDRKLYAVVSVSSFLFALHSFI